MIVRINQFDAANAKPYSGWDNGSFRGPIACELPSGTNAFEVLILESDERQQKLAPSFRQGQLRKLLLRMAENKLRDRARELNAERRDPRRLLADGEGALERVAAAGGTPSQIVAGVELLQRVREQLSGEERYLVDQRALGRKWADLAAELGDSPDALRMKHARALDRVAQQVGLDALAAE